MTSEYPSPVRRLDDHPKRRMLRKDPGGPYDGDMEPRIAKLEAHMQHVQSDVTGLKADVRLVLTDLASLKERLARLEEKVAHLPGKGFIVAALLASLAVIGGLISFQGQIQSLIAP